MAVTVSNAGVQVQVRSVTGLETTVQVPVCSVTDLETAVQGPGIAVTVPETTVTELARTVQCSEAAFRRRIGCVQS